MCSCVKYAVWLCSKKTPQLTVFSVNLQLENLTEWLSDWQGTVGSSTLSSINLPEFSHILPSSCLKRRFRQEAVSQSEIDLLSLRPSLGSSFHYGMARLFCHANMFNEAVTYINGALY